MKKQVGGRTAQNTNKLSETGKLTTKKWLWDYMCRFLSCRLSRYLKMYFKGNATAHSLHLSQNQAEESVLSCASSCLSNHYSAL